MKVQIANEEIMFFEKNGWIEFDDLLKKEEWNSLVESVNVELASRRYAKKIKEYPATSSDSSLYFSSQKNHIASHSFVMGRDLALSCQTIRSILWKKKIAETVSFLSHKKPIRWGFDQVIDSSLLSTYKSAKIDLEKSASITGLVMAGAIMLSDIQSVEKKEKKPSSYSASTLIPSAPCRVLFWKPALQFSETSDSIAPALFNFVEEKKEQKISEEKLSFLEPTTHLLLFAFADTRPIYTFNKNDSATHMLKNLGYVFGDRLKESTHPVLYR